MKQFVKEMPEEKMELIVYGYIPLMETANCIYKTMNQCKKETGDKAIVLKDRYKTCFRVMTDCENCRNTIFNSVPLSLHKEWNRILSYHNLDYRLHFTIEDFDTTKKIARQFERLILENDAPDEIEKNSFTTGHFRKGVL